LPFDYAQGPEPVEGVFGLDLTEHHKHRYRKGSEGKDLYCPNCEAEYRPGFTECADCGVPLVYELPVEVSLTPNEDRNADLVPVYSTFNPAEIMMIKSLLDAEEIIYNIQGELFKGSGIFVTPAMLFVTKADADRVVEMLRDHGIE
jgi:hypothetical protein